MTYELYWESPFDLDCSSVWETHYPPTIGSQEQISAHIIVIEFEYRYLSIQIQSHHRASRISEAQIPQYYWGFHNGFFHTA
ncbi:hypothetical protein AYI70_g776 [Smittium culicis]|uniref:Uncharacterized protein n=1 Tax=Smittium culicis TaxID=133412 RepID=A0A1R1YFB4_9FUNG|nr:hypothetical protein AYI70_g776 [Smittium culicis]